MLRLINKNQLIKFSKTIESKLNFSSFVNHNQYVIVKQNLLESNSLKYYNFNQRANAVNRYKPNFIRFIPQRNSHSSVLYAVLLANIGPILGIIIGRVVQNKWKKLSPEKKLTIIETLSLTKKTTGLLFISIFLLYLSIHKSFSEITPITRRKRLTVFNEEDYETICEVLFRIIYNRLKNKILPNSHRTTQRITRIVAKLLNSNEDFDKIKAKDWSVFVVKNPNIANAFVLPSGQIFVYTGIIRLCENDSQLGVVLAHELSHVLLEHGKELLSQEVFQGITFTLITIILWSRFKAIKALISTIVTGFGLNTFGALPTHRSIELEADYVGLKIAAKSCYDVRESSAFWRRMDAMQVIENEIFFSTHPSHRSRYEYLDRHMDDMIKLMECYNCPKLPEVDPRLTFEDQFSKVMKEAMIKNKFK